MTRMFGACAILAASAAAGLAGTPEYYTIELQFSYEITSQQATARQLGMDRTGEIAARMVFARPDCLAEYTSDNAAYPATHTQIEAFGQPFEGGMNPLSEVIVGDDFYGNDLVQINLRGAFRTKTSDVIESITLRAHNLPLDVISSNAFIGDSGLLDDVFTYPGLQSYVQLRGASGPAFSFEVQDLEISVAHTPVRPTTGPNFATCTPPPGSP